MIEQYNNQVLALSKNLAEAAFKAQSLALASFERIADIQIKTIENRMTATAAFWSEAFEARDLDGMKSIWPKSLGLAKESAEKLYSSSQEVFGLGVKTSEAFGELARGTFAATNESLVNQVNVAKAAVNATVNKATGVK